MKRHFCFPLLAAMSAFVLTSCEISYPVSHTFEFTGEHCTIYGKSEYKKQVADLAAVSLEVAADEGYSMPSEIDAPEGLTYTVAEDELTATIKIPTMRKDYSISVDAEYNKITITYQSLGEKVLSINTRKGITWKDVEKPTKDPEKDGYEFRCWSLEPSGAGGPIEDDKHFNDNTTIYAAFNYNCSLVEDEGFDSLQIDTVSGGYSEPLTITLSVKTTQMIEYGLPENDEDFIITSGKSQSPVNDYDYYHEEGAKSATLTFSNTESIKEGDIKIKIPNYRPKYKVEDKSSSNSHIKFTNEDGTVKLKDADKGEIYNFKMEAVNDSNSEGYYIDPEKPKSNISIFIGKSQLPLASKYYTVTPESEPEVEGYPKTATVTINKGVISGDIRLFGKANSEQYYQYQVFGFGIENKVLTYVTDNNPVTIQLETTDSQYELPTANEIGVSVDGQDMIKLSDVSEDIATYDYHSGTITISQGIGATHNSLEFYPVAKNFNLLDSLSWDDINTICTDEKYKPEDFFNIGDTKSVRATLGPRAYDYKARIIDFNHDTLSDKSKNAGITFEFTQSLAKALSDFASTDYNLSWGAKDNTDFDNSEFNKSLDKEVFNALDPNLRASGIIKEVIKKVGKSTDGKNYTAQDYKTKIFPFSVSEVIPEKEIPAEVKKNMTSGEGTIYEYYEDGTNKPWRYSPCSHDNKPFWFRSPCTNDKQKAFSCYDKIPNLDISSSHNVSVAFCV